MDNELDKKTPSEPAAAVPSEAKPVKKKPAVKKEELDKARKHYDRVYRVLYPIVWFFFSLVHPVKVLGRENLPEGAALICPNHTSYADPVMMLMGLGRHARARAMAKQELFRVPVLGWILKNVGVFGVRRGEADVGAIKTALRYLKAGDRLILFPEGTRVAEGEDMAAKNGATMLSVKSGAPVVPVYISSKKRWFRPSYVVIGAPYHPETAGRKITEEDYQRASEHWKQQVKQLEERVR